MVPNACTCTWILDNASVICITCLIYLSFICTFYTVVHIQMYYNIMWIKF